jgi:hypothetical protein
VNREPRVFVRLSQRAHRIGRDRRRRRCLGHYFTVGPAEAQFAIAQSLHLVALFVHCSMVPPTQQDEIRQRRWSAIRPVADVMSLAQRHPAAGESTCTTTWYRSPGAPGSIPWVTLRRRAQCGGSVARWIARGARLGVTRTRVPKTLSMSKLLNVSAWIRSGELALAAARARSSTAGTLARPDLRYVPERGQP